MSWKEKVIVEKLPENCIECDYLSVEQNLGHLIFYCPFANWKLYRYTLCDERPLWCELQEKAKEERSWT